MTAEQIKNIIDKARDVHGTVRDLRSLLNTAYDLFVIFEAGTITLTEGQQAALMEEYATLKTAIVAAYNELP